MNENGSFPKAETGSKCLRILHLSDLHERVLLETMNEHRQSLIRIGLPKRYRVLGDSLKNTLSQIAKKQPFDIVCFTGDVADWGLEKEYTEATNRLQPILEAAGVTWDQVYVVPGNHDVCRQTAKNALKNMRNLCAHNPNGVSEWMQGGPVPHGAKACWRNEIMSRQTSFRDWVERIGRKDLVPSEGRCIGYHVKTSVAGVPVFILGLDSAWISGDDNDTGKLWLTTDQILQCGTEQGEPLRGFRIALAHHPLSALADGEEARRLLARYTDLFLHGHQHRALAYDASDPDRSLRMLAAGCLYDGDAGDHWVNGFSVIDVWFNSAAQHPIRYEVDFYSWSVEGGFWHRNSALYRNAPNGHLTWPVRMEDHFPSVPYRAFLISYANITYFTTFLEENLCMYGTITSGLFASIVTHARNLVTKQPSAHRRWVRIEGGTGRLGPEDIPLVARLAQEHGVDTCVVRAVIKRGSKHCTVNGFWMTATCVTNDEYLEFTKATGRRWPTHWRPALLRESGCPFPKTDATLPVVNVSALEAQEYCTWSHTRMVRWDEWEWAAAGLDGRPYPWGQEFDPKRCNTAESGRGALVPSDDFPLGETPEGIRQLCGNVAEWVIGPEGKFELRGGSYRQPGKWWGLAYVFLEAEDTLHESEVGFRVVSDTNAPPQVEAG
jgi:calcineurin-like phosphoesterase family protein